MSAILPVIVAAVLASGDRDRDHEREHDHVPLIDTTMPGGVLELRGAVGGRGLVNGTPDVGWDAGIAYGVTSNLQVNLVFPGVVLRLGPDRLFEALLLVGTWGLRSNAPLNGFSFETGAGVGVRFWPAHSVALAFTAEGSDQLSLGGTRLPPSYTGTVALGVTIGLTDWIAVHAAVAARNTDPLIPGVWQNLPPKFGVGSVQRLGLRRLPMLELRVNPSFNLDAYATAWSLLPGTLPDTVELLVGFTAQVP